MLGFAQSGPAALRIASLTRTDHRDLAVRARVAAERLLDDWSGDRTVPTWGHSPRRCAPAGCGGSWRPTRRAARDARQGSFLRLLQDLDRLACLRPAASSPGRPSRSGSRSAGRGTRPLADRVKQTLAILEPDLRGARFLDLFAGSGAGGIEALSRGAAHATFVERDAGPSAPSRATWNGPGCGRDRAVVVRADVVQLAARPARAAEAPYDLVLVDPPYDDADALTAALESLSTLSFPGTRVVAKHFWRTPPPATVGLLASERERRFGDTALTFYRPTEDA